MKCLVTGCAGFIGSHLLEKLLAQGHDVIGLDALTPYYDPDFKRRNLRRALEHERFQFVEIDLTTAPLATWLQDVEIVFHLAGQPGVRRSWGPSFAGYTQNNVLATERLLYACVDAPLRRFVFAGSSSVYGDAPEMPWSETTCPRPRSPYAITKLAAEHLCQAYHLDFGVPTTVVRYFTVYGPRQRPDMAFHRFFRAILEQQALPVFGNGLQSRDFTYVDDIVAGTLAAATADGAVGGMFNLGGGSRITLNDLLTLMARITGTSLRIERQAPQAGDVRHTWADITRARQVLGFQPQVDLTTGLRREWAWIQSAY
ncbi:MAG: NAD-dependent epimerase/dehydratase family protein [Chloroflexi bacterium]|nr:NAD-dependent epimerase/dehydratase family protein [Chloroflexota bacterium]